MNDRSRFINAIEGKVISPREMFNLS